MSHPYEPAIVSKARSRTSSAAASIRDPGDAVAYAMGLLCNAKLTLLVAPVKHIQVEFFVLVLVAATMGLKIRLLSRSRRVRTVEEFKAGHRAFLRAFAWTMGIAAFVIIGAVAIFFRLVFDPRSNQEPPWYGVVLLFAIELSILGGGAALVERRTKLDGRITCTHCRQIMLNSSYVIATRNCAQCGRSAVAAPIEAEAPQLEVEQLRAQRHFVDRRLGLILCLAVLLFVAILATPKFGVPEGIFVSLSIICVTEFGGGLWWALRSKWCKCPHCSRSLWHCIGLVIVTRNCCHCGKRVLKEPVDLSLRRFTQKDVDAVWSAYKRTGWWVLVPAICLLCGGVFAGVLITRNTLFLDEMVAQPGGPASVIVAIVLSVVPGFVWLAVGQWLRFLSLTRNNMGCPHCGKALLWVSAAGVCACCGRQAVADSHQPREHDFSH
jgi:hypothetical protein